MPRKAKNRLDEYTTPAVESVNGLDSENGAVAVLEGVSIPKGAKKKSKAGEEASARGVSIPEPDIRLMKLRIVGTTSLIVHAWSHKAIQMILDKQMGKPHKAKEVRDPNGDYEASKYVADDGWEGVPSVAFKAAIVGACRQVSGLTMTLAKRLAFIQPDGFSSKQNIELTKIVGKARMRQDMVRIASGTADVRFRAEFSEWSTILQVEFNHQVITAQQLVNLIAIAGYSEGIGEWRPSAPESATGTHGRWKIDPKFPMQEHPLFMNDKEEAS